ncbi:MAG: ribonuclease R [Selenomonadaceae bacterium]|nr:ribonuclease R [Selenomonadaceae bacterium]
MDKKKTPTMQERILSYLKESAKRPLSAEDLAKELRLKGRAVTEYWKAMKELEETAAVICNRSGLYGLPGQMNLVVGRLSMNSKGYGFIIPDEKPADGSDIFVPGAMLDSAMNGDRVVARLSASGIKGRSAEGEIIRIIERANSKIVGTFELSDGFAFVRPDDKKIGQDIFVGTGKYGNAADGMKVVVEITRWPDKRRSAEGKVVEVLGWADAPGIDVLSIMRRYDLVQEFPPEAQAEARQIPQSVLPEEYAEPGRIDRRHFSAITIDGDDSKDFDDAVYAERRPKSEGGGFFLGVYIADVSHYVRENSPLDKEAYARGTSVYLVDRVIPMLPFELSNGICSLNEGVDRLSMACEMEIDNSGTVTKYIIAPAVIRSRHRMTYSNVNKILIDKNQQLIKEYEDVHEMLLTLADLREVLKKKRRLRGAIEFELPEVKVKLDAENHPVELIKRTGSLSESIIEECMLIANETTAKHMMERQQPFLYRVHEQPKAEKIEKLNLLLATFGLHINVRDDDSIQPADIAKVLERVAGEPEERIIDSVSLCSMQQARYYPECLGHFGLAAEYYTHFTSPIRRYPDLIVHRLLMEQFRATKGNIPAKRKKQLEPMLGEIATHTSSRERVATEAERETVKMKEVEYMAQFVGETFPGIISGVTAFGIFVELDNGVEGLVRVSRLADDYYEYVEDKYSLIGERTGHTYRLGDSCEVVLVKADLEEKTIDFELKDNSVALSGGKSRQSKKPLADKAAKPQSSVKKKAKADDKNKGGSSARPTKPAKSAKKTTAKTKAKSKVRTKGKSRKKGKR